jgi:tetratricopeptide (TPR) repeat protein
MEHQAINYADWISPWLIVYLLALTGVAAAQTPHTANDYFKRGVARYDQGDMDGAIADYDQAIALNSRFTHAKRSSPKTTTNEFNTANGFGERVGVLDQSNAAIWFNRGLAHKAKGNLEAAIADYERAIASNPRWADPYNSRGNVRKAKGDWANALGDYNKAIGLNPRYAQAYANRGLLRLQSGETVAAEQDFAQALKLAPSLKTRLETMRKAEEQRVREPR